MIQYFNNIIRNKKEQIKEYRLKEYSFYNRGIYCRRSKMNQRRIAILISKSKLFN